MVEVRSEGDNPRGDAVEEVELDATELEGERIWRVGGGD